MVDKWRKETSEAASWIIILLIRISFDGSYVLHYGWSVVECSGTHSSFIPVAEYISINQVIDHVS